MSHAKGGHGTSEQRRHWPSFMQRLVDIAVLPGDRPDVVRTKRIFAAALWAASAATTVSIYSLSAVAPWAAVTLSVPVVSAIIALLAMRIRPQSYPGVMHLVAAATLSATSALIVLFGGIVGQGASAVWGLAVVVGAAAIFADHRAHIWAGIFVVSTIGAFLVSQQIDPLYTTPDRGSRALYSLIVAGVTIYGVLYYFVRQTERLYRQSEDLLRNILPDPIVERLKSSDQMIADEYASASILFADVVEFTPMSAGLEPAEVINLLNEVFTAFDTMVAERGLEKIKTIGDAYMVASGAPVERDDHALAVCDLALSMHDHLETRAFSGHTLRIRIGIASGPVMAGIIGRRKFSYDLWGDTVNLASRMESTGVPGKTQVSAMTRDLVSPWFECEKRGLVDVKGKGQIETWYVLGRVGR